MKNCIPIFWKWEWKIDSQLLLMGGREREFPATPAKDYGRLADWANKPRVDQTTICPLVLPQPTLLLILCKCLNQPSFYSSLKPPVCKAFDGVGGAGSEILQFFWGCTMTKMSQQIQRQYCRQCNARNVEARNVEA